MQVEIEQKGTTLVARLRGEIDLKVAEKLRWRLDQAMDETTARHLLLNLQGVSFIDSSGLGVILGRYKRLDRQGGRVLIAQASEPVKRILDLAGITKLLGYSENEAAALEGGREAL